MGETEGYGSAGTRDSVTEKAVHQPGGDSENGVWRDNEKTREKEERRFRFVVLWKSTESIVDGEKDKHIDNRDHQTGMDTGVKGCIKLLWARGESRRDGR